MHEQNQTEQEKFEFRKQMIKEQQLSNKLRFEEVFHIVKNLDRNAS